MFHTLILLGLAAFGAVTFSTPSYAETPALSLDAAIGAALQSAPSLQAANARSNAAAASRAQAAALPNPEISIEAENLYGDYSGAGDAEISYGISQLVELPGKRKSRRQIANSESLRAAHEAESHKLDIIHAVTLAFAETIAAEAEVELLQEEYARAENINRSVSARVDAGKEPPIQKKKADIERKTSEMALARARQELATKRKNLDLLTGEENKEQPLDPLSLPPVTAPRHLADYLGQLTASPDLKAFDAGIGQADGQLSLEKTETLPDPTFSIGIKDAREDNTRSFMAGVSFAIPVFNRNRGNIERAGHDANAARFDRRNAEQNIQSALTEAHGNLGSAYNEAQTLQTVMIPGAEEAFDFAQQGYEAGKFGYLEVLDAQRTLFETRRNHNAAVLDYRRQRAHLERLAPPALIPSSENAK